MFENTDLLLGWIICTWAVASLVLGIHDVLKDTNDQLTKKLHRRLNDIVHRVRVEKDQDTYYWYDYDDHEFLGQGSSDEEIIHNLQSRFPDHIFYLPTNHFISRATDWKPKMSSIDSTDLTKNSQ